MELNERKKIILRSIIEDYIESAEPVGSRTISKHTDLGLSSATIRNEMADLEEMGYLISPHTSAGRIPSDAGYRFYVNELMTQKSVAYEDIVRLRRYFAAGILQLDRIIQRAGSVLSQLTDYTTISVTPEIKESYLKHIELIPIDKYSILLILVTNEGVVKNKIINAVMSEGEARAAGAVLNEMLTGKTLDEISIAEMKAIDERVSDRALLCEVMEFVHEVTGQLNGAEIFVENPQHMLNHPEYHELGRAKGLLQFLDDKESIKSAVDQGKSSGISIVIGHENKIDQIKDASLVTAGYTINGKPLGKIGIVGPTRMDYAKVVNSLETIRRSIDNIVNEIYKAESEDDGR